MKPIHPIFLCVLLLFSCKQDPNTETNDSTETLKTYPAAIQNIFETHGGIQLWNEMNQLAFTIKEGDAEETHITSLKDRKARIENKNWTIGHDGTDVWLTKSEEDAYKGNARVYHNLMFYFYAMPFVVADDGITYTEVEATELGGEMYKGVKVSYADNIGDSPKDEYIVFFDEQTNQMEWLGYTVTYRTKEKSDKWSYIKYDDWETVNGLALPKKLVWYKVEDGKPTEPAGDGMSFNNIKILKEKADDTQFSIPDGSEIVDL